jgi:uncharacterized Tic20 family protein
MESERRWASLAHLSGLAWLSGVPFAGSIASAILYLTKRSLSPFVADQTREAQNFQNTVSIAVAVVVAACAVLFGADMLATMQTGRSDLDAGSATSALWTIVAMALFLAAIMVANIALSIVAAVATHHGHAFRYPVNLRLLRGPAATKVPEQPGSLPPRAY